AAGPEDPEGAGVGTGRLERGGPHASLGTALRMRLRPCDVGRGRRPNHPRPGPARDGARPRSGDPGDRSNGRAGRSGALLVGRRAPAMLAALRAAAARSQEGVLRLLRERGRAARARVLWIDNSVAVTVPPGLLDELAALPGVDHVDFDEPVTMGEAVPDEAA